MFSKRVGAVVVVLAFAIFMAGCCNEEDCRNDYGLIKTKAECLETYDTLVDFDPGAGDSPIIILEPNASTPGFLGWREEGGSTWFSAGPSMFDSNGFATLREDFIGTRVLQLKYLPEGETNWVEFGPKDRLYVKSSSATLNGGKNTILLWNVVQLIGNKFGGSPTSTDQYDPTTVPLEFANLANADLNIWTPNDPQIKADKIKFQVYP